VECAVFEVQGKVLRRAMAILIARSCNAAMCRKNRAIRFVANST